MKLSLLSALRCQVLCTDVSPPAAVHGRFDFATCRNLRCAEADVEVGLRLFLGEFTSQLDGDRTARSSILARISGVGFKVLGCQLALKMLGLV